MRFFTCDCINKQLYVDHVSVVSIHVKEKLSNLDPFFKLLAQNNSIDVNGRNFNIIRVDFSYFDNFLNFGNRNFCSLAHWRVEISRRFSVK